MNLTEYWPLALVGLPLLAGLVGYAIARHQGKAPRAALQLALEELKAVSKLLLLAQEQLTTAGPGSAIEPHVDHVWSPIPISRNAKSHTYQCKLCPQTRQVPRGAKP